MRPSEIAVIGDYSSTIAAHQAIPRALDQAVAKSGGAATWSWIQTKSLEDPVHQLAHFDGFWFAPGSPYENTRGVIAAIQWTRETRRPTFGSCGGFQHMAIEFARHAAGLADADHAETNPTGRTLVVSRLSCSLVEAEGSVTFAPDSQLRAIFGAETKEARYRCNYGIAPAYRSALEHAGMRFTGFDEAGEIRACELSEAIHPFYIGTLFQPERAVLSGKPVPVADALVNAAVRHRRGIESKAMLL